MDTTAEHKGYENHQTGEVGLLFNFGENVIDSCVELVASMGAGISALLGWGIVKCKIT
jgi:hypothetical protein